MRHGAEQVAVVGEIYNRIILFTCDVRRKLVMVKIKTLLLVVRMLDTWRRDPQSELRTTIEVQQGLVPEG